MLVFFIPTDGGPTRDNVESSCSVVLDRTAVAYDITFHLRFDETFIPAVISAINFLRASTFRVNSLGEAIFSEATTRPIRLGSSDVTQGPFALDVLFDNLGQRANGLGYQVTVSKQCFHAHACMYCNCKVAIPKLKE